MSPKEREAWNSRPVTTTTSTLCEECEKLKPDPEGQERRSYWPIAITRTCCEACFKKLAVGNTDVVIC